MSLLHLNPNERFVSNMSHARSGLRELKAIEDSFARHIGKIEGAIGPRIVRSISTSRSDLDLLKKGAKQEFGTMTFRSSYRLETDDTMVGFDRGDGKGFIPNDIGRSFTRDQAEKRDKLRWSTREALVNAIRSITADVMTMQSIDIMELSCVGTEFLKAPIMKQNNVLQLQHTVMLDYIMYEDQATLVELLRQGEDTHAALVSRSARVWPMYEWPLKQEISFEAVAAAIKFVAFDEITIIMQKGHWERVTGKVDSDIPNMILYRKDWPLLKHRDLRLERLNRELSVCAFSQGSKVNS